MRNAKIVCTIGPASDSPETLEALAEAGMSVARMNASHGTTDQRRTIIERVREVDAKTDRPVAVMHDLPGPEIRTAPIDEKIQLEAGSTVRFVEGKEATPEEVGVSHSLTAVEPGDRILLDDGRIETTVQSVAEDSVTVTIKNGGELGGRKGVNVPGVELGLPTVTEQDRRELEVAADKEVDFVAASFVRDGEFIYEISDTLEELGADIPIIAKIERDVAVDNIDSIIDAAYGVMVARGDLGVEMPLEDVPMTQKRIINKCRNAGVPVITATEMLDSMTENRRPTRAEASDVANAVLDGTDAVMLSGETAMGAHPPLVVETMDRIVRDVERSDEYKEIVEQNVPDADMPQTDALARSARYLARDIGASAIVAASESGYTAQKVSKFRPPIPIVGSTPSDEVRRRLALSWGIISETTPYTSEGASAVIENAVQTGLETEAVDSGDTVVVLSGMMTELDSTSSSNTLKIHVATETVGTGQSVVDGVAVGAFHWVDSGDRSEIPEGAIVGIPQEFDGELSGDLDGISGIVDCHGELASSVRTVARDHDIPTITSGDLTGTLEDGEMVTLDAERGIIYRGEVTQLKPDHR
jgi:pyruvate kinase